MNREEALALLGSRSPQLRLRAARALSRVATPDDLSMLRSTLSVETDHYVLAALTIAIRRITETPTPTETLNGPEGDNPQDEEQIFRRALQQTSRIILHEVSTPFASLALSAKNEIANYEDSRSKIHIESVRAVLIALEQLGAASSLAKPEEFDISVFVEELIESDFENEKGHIVLHGPRPQLVVADKYMLRLALANGIRNALEASYEADSNFNLDPIVVNWGATTWEYWLVVLDHGVGLADSIMRFSLGTTTKEGHLGFGLPIADAAAKALNGSIRLTADKGAKTYEICWEISE